MMNIRVLGLNHKTAPIEIRERASFSNSRLDEALRSLRASPGVEELVLLSTCNRTEFYVSCPQADRGLASVWEFVEDAMGMPAAKLKQYFYVHGNRDAVEHLLCVAASLDSMVVGETQVFGQVKDAYFAARRNNAAGKVMDCLFGEAIRVGKKVRTDTQIGKGAVSTSTAAIELARKIFETLQDKVVLIIGAGKIGELTVKNLYSRGVSTVIVANRTLVKAQDLARQFCGTAIHFDGIIEHMCRADIVLSSTSAPHFLVTREDICTVMRMRNNAPLFLIDLGLPRNIDPATNDIANVYLYNIDDLSRVCDANMKERLSEAKKARAVISRAAESLCERMNADLRPDKVSAS
ncbi:MAG: glutamyl-tRNA reductase [Candidatus Omnitrophica bacterium]|nr:glutamyl-tRNA reductase [Candidatus Omnitrophota bacterium]